MLNSFTLTYYVITLIVLGEHINPASETISNDVSSGGTRRCQHNDSSSILSFKPEEDKRINLICIQLLKPHPLHEPHSMPVAYRHLI